MIKKCTECGKEFVPKRNEKTCGEDCSRKRRNSYLYNYHKQYVSNNREYVLDFDRKYMEKLRHLVLTHYGGNPPKCACCGETVYDFLTIDHINNDGAEQRKNKKIGSGRSFYMWIVRNNFPEGLQVMCANCNFVKGRKKSKVRFCPVHHPELYKNETLL